VLARAGRSVLLAEHHHKLGGLATWFRRGSNTFDVALHGFPVGMIKSCRRYWSGEIADSIVQLKDIRFDNPMFSLSTTFDRQDLPGCWSNSFECRGERRGIFRRGAEHELLRRSDDHDRPAFRAVLSRTRRRGSAADGADHLCKRSTLEDPALSYGIVFSNFMSKASIRFTAAPIG